MSKSEKKDIIASIQNRLKNKAREANRPYQELLIQYGIERFLYRLSKSSYARQLILKGGLMQFIWSDMPARPTRDIDFLEITSNNLEDLSVLVKSICEWKVEEDGITFDLNSLNARSTIEGEEYHGARITFAAYLGNQKIPMQIDIGIGDIVFPESRPGRFPSLLGHDSIFVRSYSMESVIAEKFHAMVKLDEANSRMKGFYDIWILAQTFEFDGEQLAKSICRTFQRRATAVTDAPLALNESFANLPNKENQWRAFIRKSELVNIAPQTLMATITQLSRFLLPMCKALVVSKPFSAKWKPGDGWNN